MLKVKHLRTADCVVAGFRMHKDGDGVGSLLLGLYDDDGVLHHVGVASSFAAPRAPSSLEELEPYRAGALEGHPWREWAEADAEAAAAGRAAHAGRAEPVERRARTSAGSRCASSSSPRSPTSTCRATASATPPASSAGAPTATPASCTYEQLEVPVPMELQEIFGV